VRRPGATAAALGFVVLFLAPFAWQLLTSFWPADELARAWPSRLGLDAYRAVLRARGFGRVILVTLGVAAATTALALAAAVPAAFALAKLPLRRRGLLLGGILAAGLFPPIAAVSPLYAAYRALGLLDRPLALALPDAAAALPLAIWLLTTFFREVPDELYAAALLDGCTPSQILRRVYLPLSAPGIATTAVLVFVAAWNELLYALSFIASPGNRTVPAAIALFAGEHVEPWAEIAAASTLATLPLAALMLLFQRRIVSGLTAGAVKG
jgi:multiple sugar transport system permease protein